MYEKKDVKKTEKAYETLEDSFACYDYLGSSASAHDCTGLIPSGPVSEEELLSYKDVYDFPPPGHDSPRPEKEKIRKSGLLILLCRKTDPDL